ncbi:MAG: hypothetical protein WCK63_14210 [Betaproteobacteria bacterium]
MCEFWQKYYDQMLPYIKKSLGVIFLAVSQIAFANPETWVLDDGVTDITPVYVMTHSQENSFTFVRADFWFISAKKSVKLQESGSVSVNGVELRGEPSKGYSYVGNIPVTEGKITFRVVRGEGQVLEHTFELPVLDILEFPKTYQPYEPIQVPVKYTAASVGETVINMNIEVPGRNFPFNSRIAPDHVLLNPIIKVPLPKGTFSAKIYRQHRTPLKEISNSKTGWAVATNSRSFTIDILETK